MNGCTDPRKDFCKFCIYHLIAASMVIRWELGRCCFDASSSFIIIKIIIIIIIIAFFRPKNPQFSPKTTKKGVNFEEYQASRGHMSGFRSGNMYTKTPGHNEKLEIYQNKRIWWTCVSFWAMNRGRDIM